MASIASISQDSRRSVHTRDSSRSGGQRRPRLLRASATEPSIKTTSNTSRGSLTNAQSSSRRATDLLSQVAYSTSPDSVLYRGSSPTASQSPIFDRMVDRTGDDLSSSPRSHDSVLEDEMRPHPYSVRYFSFPSFDTWEAEHEEKGDSGEKSP